MSSSLLKPPASLSYTDAQKLAQEAPSILKNNPASFSSSPLLALLSAKETPELWVKYENLLVTCLRAGDDSSASQCLGRIANRFGDDNERVMALKGLAEEAEAKDDRALDEILKRYNRILSENSTNIPIIKRRIALLRSLGRLPDAVASLNGFLDISPTDAEAWSELSDIYLSQGLYPQAIFALEEVLVLTPNAWNMHARLGEVLYMAATTTAAIESPAYKYLAEGVRRFCRSIELCDDYLRGYYGLKMATSHILKTPPKAAKHAEEGELTLPNTSTMEKLNEMATSKLSEIVRRSSQKEQGWQGYDEAEVTAARALLDKDSSNQPR